MRPIKFRVWDGELMLPAESIHFDTETVEVLIPCDAFGCEGHPIEYDFGNVVLMEYTGLYDKNGKEIYEGDILLVTSEIYTNFGKTPTGRFSKEYYEVIWKEDGWGYKVLRSDHTIEGTEIKGLKVTTKYAEVIGNIYKNPELVVAEVDES
jgi:uncharacterized phage protein (TIGR01671 family)